jgi:acetyl-CoA synthetase
MSEQLVFQPSAAAIARTHVTKDQYEQLYARSVSDPNGFWAEQAQRIDWMKSPTIIKNSTFQYPDVSIKWFEDGVLNISANCIDRHLVERGDEVAGRAQG